MIFEGGGAGRIEKKIPAEVSQRKKNHATQMAMKKMPTQITRQKVISYHPRNALWKGCSPGNLGNYTAPFRE